MIAATCTNADISWLHGADGVRLRVAHWRGGDRGTIVIFPGRTEYCEKYDHIAARFTAQGYDVTAIDWRGQGLADRLIPDRNAGHIDNFADYQIDVAAYLSRISSLPGPKIMLAHSMGGCIGLRCLHTDHPFQKAVFSSPMWGINFPKWLSPFVPCITKTLDYIGFGEKFAAGTSEVSHFLEGTFEDNRMTTDQATWEQIGAQMRHQPELSLGGPTWRWIKAATAEMNELAAMPAPSIPALTFFGSSEAVVSKQRIINQMAKWDASPAPSHLIEYPDRRHECLFESADKMDEAMDQIFDFIGQ